MKCKVYQDKILHIKFKTQKELTLTMCRLQEYYECDSKKLRGNYFTFEDFLDYQMDNDGNISYFNFWAGFNVPGNKCNEFFYNFGNTFTIDSVSKERSLTKREQKLRNLILLEKKTSDYYVIATLDTDKLTVEHELAHAYYYLSDVYRQEVNVLVKHMNKNLKDAMTVQLKNMGYAKKVLTDEINAYMSTSSLPYLRKNLGLTVSKKDIEPFVNLYKRFKQNFK